MARCNCGNQTCSCVITAGDGITIEGNGTPTRPYAISADSAYPLSELLAVAPPNASLSLSTSGAGTASDRLIIDGIATQSLRTLTDVNDPNPPTNGDVPTWVTDHWEFLPQSGGGGGGTDEVVIASGSAPTTPGLELWVDLDSNPVDTSDTGWITDSGGSSVLVIDPAVATLNTSVVRRIGNRVQVYFYLVTKVAFTVPANGDVANTTFGTLAPAWAPVNPPVEQGLHCGSSGRMASWLIGNTGALRLNSVAPGSNIAIGDAFTISGSYLI